MMKNKQEKQQQKQHKAMSYTESFAARWKREKIRKNTQTDLRGSPWVRLHPRERKIESFLLLMQYISGSLFLKNTGHSYLI